MISWQALHPASGSTKPRWGAWLYLEYGAASRPARFQAKSREFSRLGFETGRREPLLPPEEVAAYEYSPAELVTVERFRRKAIVGSGPQVAEKLNELADSLKLEELAIVTWTYDTAPRHRSYEILAREFKLSPRAA